MRTIHSVINFTPSNLLEEVVLIDDGSVKDHLVVGGRLEEHIKQWNGLVKERVNLAYQHWFPIISHN